MIKAPNNWDHISIHISERPVNDPHTGIRPYQVQFYNVTTDRYYMGEYYSTKEKAEELAPRNLSQLKTWSPSFWLFAEIGEEGNFATKCPKCQKWFSLEDTLNEVDFGENWVCDPCLVEHYPEEANKDDDVDWVGVDASVFNSQERRHNGKI